MTEVLRGEFTIDRVRAREKLSRYQLADPYAYVLELVQSAFLRGARTIRFEFDSDDMILSFDGEPYSETDLSHLEMAILEDADSRAARSRRQLAIGLLAAEALNPKLIIVDSQGGYRLAVRQGESERLNPSSRTPPGTVIQVRERWRPKLLLKFWQNLREKGREQLLIREHCCSAAKPIFIGDDLVSQRPHGAPNGLRYGEVSIETEGFSGWGGFIAGEESELHLLCEGVLVERVPLQLGPLPFRAVISGEKLEKDLSGGAVRRNSGFKEMMVEVERARKRALQIFCRQNPTEFREQARRELLEVGSVKKMQDEDVYPGCLAKLRVWNLANGEYATFEELLAARRTHGFLPYSLESLGQHALPEMPVIWLWDKELLPKLKNMVYLRNVTRRLRKLRTAELNREKWLATPTEPKLSGPGYLAIAELNHQGIRGEVGIRKSGGPPLIRFIKNGCLLAELTPTFWPLGVEVVVEADFQPNSSFNGVRADEVAARTVARALAPLPGLFERVAQPRFFEFFWSRPQETLDMLGDYVRVRAQPNCFDRMLESCQISAQDFPELERPEGWQDGELDQDSSLLDVRWLKTENGEKRSLRELSREAQSRSRLVLNPTQRKTLENILGDDFLQPPVGHSKSKTEATEFVADEKWLQEEYFLTAFRTELRSVKEKDHDLLISNLRISRILLTDLEKEKAVKLDDSDYILLNRNHPLVQEALTCYEAQPCLLYTSPSPRDRQKSRMPSSA